MAKSQAYKEEIYPDEFTDDDKVNFDSLLAQAINIYPNYESWIMKLAIVAYINKENGRGIPLDKEEALKLREKYLNIQPIYETPPRPPTEDNLTANNILSNE
jgi:hypothetical protein